tara:strand:- start:70 stop:2475 length:2406 start_codon:yes stop_codon:yes gene_type:complete
MALPPRKTYPELTALSAPVVDSDVLAAYRSPGPLKRFTAAQLLSYASAPFALSTGAALVGSINTGTGAVAETVQTAMRRLGVFVDQFGAVADMVKLTDGAITSGTPNFTSASAVFVAGDVGKTIKIAGAGASGIPLVTTIIARISNTAVTLAANASATVSGKLCFYGTNNATAFQAAVTASLLVKFDGQYLIGSTITLRAGQQLEMTPRTMIVQSTSGIAMFKATALDNITALCNGAQLWGQGLFGGNPGGPWTGNTNSSDRAFEFIGCDNLTIADAYVRDCGQAGMLFRGCTKVFVSNPRIEGTHTHSTPIQWPFVSPGNQANFQNGIALVGDATYGPCDEVSIIGPDISGTAQGILYEWEAGVPPQSGINVVGGMIHDIPGQHGAYIQAGCFNITGTQFRRIALSAVKTQLGGGTVTDIEGCSYTAIDGEYLGSQLFEFGVPLGVGYIRGVYAQGRARKCGRLASLAINIENVELHVTGEDIYDAAFQFSGANINDIRVYMSAQNIGGSGIRDYSDGADKVVFYDTRIANVNMPVTDTFVTRAGQTTFTAVSQVASVTVNGSASTFTMGNGVFTPNTVPTTGQTVVATYTAGNGAANSGMRFSGTNSPDFTFLNLDVSDSAGTMYAAAFLETGTPVVKMVNQVQLLDGTDYSARVASGSLTLPATTEVDMPYLGLTSIFFIGNPQFSVTSSGSTTGLRAAVPSAVGTFVVQVTLVANKTDDTQQKATTLSRCFTYDGTTVLAVAATVETVIGASGTFDGTYSLNAGTGGTTGANTWNVLVSNSGGGSFDWKMQENVVYV